MERMTVRELKAKYAEVFGEQARTSNKDCLVKRFAWRLQVLAEGDITERAFRRAGELANDADLRIRAPKAEAATEAGGTATATVAMARSDEPPPGAVLRRPADRSCRRD